MSIHRYRQLLSCLDQPENAARAALPRWRIARDLAEVLTQHGEPEEAAACYRKALAEQPDDLVSLTDLGNLLRTAGRLDDASACYEKVLRLAPELAGAHCNMGTVAQSVGRYDEAIAYYRAALSRDPKLLPIWSNLGACLTYSPNHGPQDVLEAYREFDRVLAAPLRDARPHANFKDPDRRLRIGYVSADFRRHAVAYFSLPLIEGHRRDQVETVCYYSHRQTDEWTQRFRRAAGQWVPCADMDDAALAERIRADEIDILVDLIGHTEGSRILTFAHKPAPIQVTWLGYVTTTGLAAMDYRITHADTDPPGAERDYCERLWRLPGAMWCYRPLANMPEVAVPPFRRNGYVTFGSFNRFSKVSERVLECWASILAALPNSRLVLCLPEGNVRQQVAAFFARRGVAPERVAAYAKLEHEQFWALHGEVDIALDPFPFNGGTTTCETLWLGVPLVTCTGIPLDGQQNVNDAPGRRQFASRFSSRMGYFFLNNVGLPELAAKDEDEYVALAVSLAKDENRLADLRAGLRDRMAAAPVTDEARFVREMEDAYRGMWREWCRP